MSLQTENLVKIYSGRAVVNGVSIRVERGEVVGLLGPNGAGKTTTFYMVVGQIKPNGGKVFLDGKEISKLPMYQRAREGIGYLTQEPSIFRKLSVADNIRLILQMLPLSEKERQERLEGLLQELNISDLRGLKGFVLSGGERRRVEIARALTTSPSFLLLDEPFTGIDPIAIEDIKEIILHLKKKNIGILLTDHNVRETLTITDRSYIIHQGKILTEGASDKLVNDPIAKKFYLGDRFTI